MVVQVSAAMMIEFCWTAFAKKPMIWCRQNAFSRCCSLPNRAVIVPVPVLIAFFAELPSVFPREHAIPAADCRRAACSNSPNNRRLNLSFSFTCRRSCFCTPCATNTSAFRSWRLWLQVLPYARPHCHDSAWL